MAKYLFPFPKIHLTSTARLKQPTHNSNCQLYKPGNVNTTTVSSEGLIRRINQEAVIKAVVLIDVAKAIGLALVG